MAAIDQMPDTLPSNKKLEQFLTDLACRHQVSASTQNQALNAILFFYAHVLDRPIQDVNALRAKRPIHMRRAPSVEETAALLQTVRNVGQYPTNLIARMLYGCGLRVSEPLNLRIKDVDLNRSYGPARYTKGRCGRLRAIDRSDRRLSNILPQMSSRAILKKERRQTNVMAPANRVLASMEDLGVSVPTSVRVQNHDCRQGLGPREKPASIRSEFDRCKLLVLSVARVVEWQTRQT